MKRFHGATGGAIRNSLARRNQRPCCVAQVQSVCTIRQVLSCTVLLALRMIISAQVNHYYRRWTVVHRSDKQHSEG